MPAPLPTLPTLVLAIAAAAAPTLLAWNVSPSSTFLNQALAVGLWGAFATASALAAPATHRLRSHPAAAVLAALALVALAVLWSWGPGALPHGLALSALGLLAAAALLLHAGSAARAADGAGDDTLVTAFCVGTAVAGVLGAAVGAVQVFAPEWADGDWIARTNLPGRAVGNVRQPNHLSSVLLWGAIAVVALLELGRLGRRAAAALFALLVFALVLTASRTGLVSVGLLALWGLLDRRRGATARLLLIAAPLVYAAGWWALTAWAATGAHRFGGAERLAETDISGSRFGIWANTLALIRAQPWAGVGFGEFNFAWTLTPFPGRPTAFFDHAHNLPLHLAAELGLPLATLVIALLAAGLWQAWRRSAGSAGARGALLVALMIGLHSLLEYPLWYAYFLLPAAWAWGYALGVPARAAARRSPLQAAGGALLVIGAALSVADYARVAVIFSAPADATPLARRIERGQRSVLFAHHADYAAATAADPPPPDDRAFAGATHYLLDTRLMTAWARSLAAAGRVDEARHLAARLREFNRSGSDEFFAPCEDAASAARAFQCAPPAQVPGWREFVAR